MLETNKQGISGRFEKQYSKYSVGLTSSRALGRAMKHIVQNALLADHSTWHLEEHLKNGFYALRAKLS